jgi:hypothetical protein
LVTINGLDGVTGDVADFDRSLEDTARIDHLVLRLNAVCKATTFDFAMAVGKLVVDSCYGGDPKIWRDRGRKDTSFRKLARHPDLAMSASALYNSVAIYELSQRLGISSWKRMSTSHLRLVLPLSPNDQERLLRLAENQSWPVTRLNEEVRRLRAPQVGGRGGRRRLSRVRTGVQSLERSLKTIGELVQSERHADVSPKDASSILELLARIGKACEALEVRLKTCVEGARTDLSPSLELRRSGSALPHVCTWKHR